MYDDDYSISQNLTTCYYKDNYSKYVDLVHDEGFTENSDGYFEFWLDALSSEETVFKRVEYLQDRNWVDEQTETIRISLLLYNGQMEPLISEVKIRLQVTRVEIFEPSILIETLPLDPYFSDFELKILLEIFYVLLICHVGYIEASEIRGRMVYGGMTFRESLVAHFSTKGKKPIGNILDLVMLAICVALLFVWVFFVYHMEGVRKSLIETTEERPGTTIDYNVDDDGLFSVWEHYHHKLASTEHKVTEAIEMMVLIRQLSTVVMFLLVFRLFKICDGIPALRTVTQTIIIAVKRLAAFAVILTALIVLFAGAGMLAFGQQMEEFHSFWRAVISTLIIMTTGEAYYYDRQFEIDPVFACLWHWFLIAVMWVVCLNIILCILVDSYAEAQAKLVGQEEEGKEGAMAMNISLVEHSKVAVEEIFRGVDIVQLWKGKGSVSPSNSEVTAPQQIQVNQSGASAEFRGL